jgi:hypothetical protein
MSPRYLSAEQVIAAAGAAFACTEEESGAAVVRPARPPVSLFRRLVAWLLPGRLTPA